MIRYDANLNRELARTVKNYNAKLARLQKQGIETGLERASIRTIRREYSSRRDLLSYIREMRAFGQRGVERIAIIDKYKKPITQYEINIAKSRQQRAIRIAEAKIAEARGIHRTTRGEDELQTLMGTDYENNLQANLKVLQENKFTKGLSDYKKAKIIRAERSIFDTEARAKRAKDNFFDILKAECEYTGQMSKYEHITSMLYKLNAKQWELARNGEELVVALIEDYPRMAEASTDAEKDALKNDLGDIISMLDSSVDNIYQQYSQL